MPESKDFDPNGLLAAMIGYHEILSSAMQAGFTRKEAFELVQTTVRAQMENEQRASE